MRRPRLFFLAVVFLATIGFIATDIYLPSLPAIGRDLSTNDSSVQMTLSLYLFSFGASQLIYGPLSDKIGRRKVALFGLLFAIIGSCVCIFSPHIFVLILGRFLEGMGIGAGVAVMRPILRDVYSGDELSRRGSLLNIGTGVCMAAAPTLGGYIQHGFGWRFNFVFIALYTLFGVLFVFSFLSETHKELNPHATRMGHFFRQYLDFLKNLPFLSFAICSSVSFAGLAAYLAVSPFLFQNIIGLNPVEYGWLAIFIAAGIALGGYLNHFFVARFGRHKMLVAGIYLQIASGLFLLLPALFGYIHTWAIIVPMLIYMFGMSIVLANAFASAFHGISKGFGFAGALYGCLQILGGAIASALMAIVQATSQTPLAVFILAISVCGFGLQRLAHLRK